LPCCEQLILRVSIAKEEDEGEDWWSLNSVFCWWNIKISVWCRIYISSLTLFPSQKKKCFLLSSAAEVKLYMWSELLVLGGFKVILEDDTES
jgi:hypothetical protein